MMDAVIIAGKKQKEERKERKEGEEGRKEERKERKEGEEGRRGRKKGRKEGDQSVSKSTHQIQPGCEELACIWCIARPNSQAQTGTGKIYFPVQETTSRIGNHIGWSMCVWVCVCCHPIYSGRTSRGHTGGTSHRIFLPSFRCLP